MQLIMYLVCVITFCKHDILKTNLWIFANFVADSPYTLPWKWLTYSTHQIQDG